MTFLETVKKVAPFIIGLLIGAGLTRNKYIWMILIFYIILMVSINLFAKKATKIKEAADKKIALKEAGAEVLANATSYVAEGHSVGATLFDEWFPKLSVFIAIIMVFYLGYNLWHGFWINSFIILFALFTYIILSNIWRKVKEVDGIGKSI